MNEGQPQTAPETPVDTAEPVFHDDNKKSSPTGLIIGLVLLALIAAGGIGFGVWQMMQGSSKDKQIADLKTQVANCATTNGGDEALEFENPVIESTESEGYNISFQSGPVQGTSVDAVNIIIKDGSLAGCTLMDKEYLENGGYRGINIGECNITGLTGKVYKVVEFGAGQVNSDDSIGFIMTDGTVQYFPLYDAVNNSDFSIKGSLDIDGYVVDVVNVGVSDLERGYGGYQSSFFVLSDGSYKKYDASMLK